ncbi:MAG: HTH domain-containing protein [Nitratireductor sp.]|jgi:predicted transcriptional regulator|nr:HTH domain-containing protein [Nitratireductor sp.]
MNTLHIEVQSAEAALARFGAALESMTKGRTPRAYTGIGFENMAQFGEVFSPKRWELVEALKEAGPLSIYALAKRLGRHYRNVYKDVSVLSDWLVVSKDEAGKVYVPWDEIDVRLALVKQAA